MPFEWHAAKAASNLEKHGVSFDEAATVFDDPFQVHYPDDAHSIGEQRFICLGMSDQGRLLKLAYTECCRTRKSAEISTVKNEEKLTRSRVPRLIESSVGPAKISLDNSLQGTPAAMM